MSHNFLFQTFPKKHLPDNLNKGLRLRDSYRPDIANNNYSKRLYFCAHIVPVIDIAINFEAHGKDEDYCTVILDRTKIEKNMTLSDDDKFEFGFYTEVPVKKDGIVGYFYNSDASEHLLLSKLPEELKKRYNEEINGVYGYDSPMEILYEDIDWKKEMLEHYDSIILELFDSLKIGAIIRQ